MKNILKKIGVIGIIIAMLAPFVEMPVAKAATETCTDHTVMQYYFADVTNGDSWDHYTGTGYATYTIFPFTFPKESGKTVKILNTQMLNIETGNTVTSDNGITLANFWSDVKSLQNTENYQISGNEIAGKYITKDKSSYKVVKLLHGMWEREVNGISEAHRWDNIPEDENVFLNHTVQNVFSDSEISLAVSSAKYIGTGNKNSFGAADETNLADYFQNLVSNNNSEYIKETNGEKAFALRVNRAISENVLNTKHFGYQCEYENSCGAANQGKYAIYTTDDNSDNDAKTIKNSFTAMNSNSSSAASPRKYESTGNNINIMASENYYWPAVLNVEYEVCTNTSEQWTLKYDGNTDDNSANNIPEKVQKSVTEDAVIDSKTPTRNGYTFKGWNTEKDGSGKTYNAGDKYETPGKADVRVLYAQWGNASKGEQKPTGVASYIIGFISVGIVAGGIYLIAKKKNLFKQI